MRIAELGLLLPDVFMINVFPVLSGAFRTAEDVFARWQRIAVRAMLAYSLPLAACLLVGADDIVRLLFGDGFETAATVLRLLALNIVFFSLGAVFWRSLVARDGQRENVVIQSAMAVTRVGLGIVLIIPRLAVGAGIAGAATAGLNWWLLARATGRAGAPERVLALAWLFRLRPPSRRRPHGSLWIACPPPSRSLQRRSRTSRQPSRPARSTPRTAACCSQRGRAAGRLSPRAPRRRTSARPEPLCRGHRKRAPAYDSALARPGSPSIS